MRVLRSVFFGLLLLPCTISLWSSPEIAHPEEILGMPLDEIFSVFGTPEEVNVCRGEEPWQDDVVFYYSDNVYLYIFQNRVWQIRYDKRYTGSVLGISIGNTQDDITALLGRASYNDGESLIITLPSFNYPIRVRCFFEEGRLSDLYIFRGDF